jgi:signal transduction histidine kinase
MTFPRSAARTAGFSALYLVAMFLGRQTVMDGTDLSLVWPAAGVLALWFGAQRASRWRWLDVLSLAVITMTVNVVTGATAALAAVFVAANLAQGCTFAVLVGRWLPEALITGNDGPVLSRLRQFWRVVGLAVLSSAAGTLIGPTGIWLLTGHYLWESAVVWMTRNVVAVVLVVVAGRHLGHLVQRWWRCRGTPRTGPGPWRSLPARKQAEYVAVLVASVVAYHLMFGFGRDLPAAFALIAITVWAGLRLSTGFVILHDLVFGTVAILFTLRGYGPFALIESQAVRALIAQLFVGTVTVVGLSLALSRDERDALTARLRQQTQLLTTVIESVSEGIAVVDEKNGFLVRNPAIGRLLGGFDTPGDRVESSTYYGLFHPDGTPIAERDLPHRRVFAGEQLDPVEMVIRNAGIPEGRIVVVNTALMPGRINGLRHLVVAMHDVTEDRRHRDELANFAGVVAHDLLNPLATVEGWSQALLEDLDDPAALTDGITRIQRASARMRALIDDLLVYTTARDAALAPAHCDLGSLVADIAAGRRDHAQSAGETVPVFRFNGLAPVDGDPVLVRQLMENLIGNAIKYTAPGVTPTITVTTHADTAGPGMTRVEITDNGIGIPVGQHDAVFGNFHRAHVDAGYSGTGLGLAICKRIVERHGGTICASDNPDGRGTRVSFTLPSSRLPGRAPTGPHPYRLHPSFERAR